MGANQLRMGIRTIMGSGLLLGVGTKDGRSRFVLLCSLCIGKGVGEGG